MRTYRALLRKYEFLLHAHGTLWAKLKALLQKCVAVLHRQRKAGVGGVDRGMSVLRCFAVWCSVMQGGTGSARQG